MLQSSQLINLFRLFVEYKKAFGLPVFLDLSLDIVNCYYSIVISRKISLRIERVLTLGQTLLPRRQEAPNEPSEPLTMDVLEDLVNKTK